MSDHTKFSSKSQRFSKKREKPDTPINKSFLLFFLYITKVAFYSGCLLLGDLSLCIMAKKTVICLIYSLLKYLFGEIITKCLIGGVVFVRLLWSTC